VRRARIHRRRAAVFLDECARAIVGAGVDDGDDLSLPEDAAIVQRRGSGCRAGLERAVSVVGCGGNGRSHQNNRK
jgi:hypothetical protein